MLTCASLHRTMLVTGPLTSNPGAEASAATLWWQFAVESFPSPLQPSDITFAMCVYVEQPIATPRPGRAHDQRIPPRKQYWSSKPTVPSKNWVVTPKGDTYRSRTDNSKTAANDCGSACWFSRTSDRPGQRLSEEAIVNSRKAQLDESRYTRNSDTR
jgi:hypothetical protein